MYKMMKELIEKRFYKTADEAHGKPDAFFACNRLTDDEYSELTILVVTTYTAEATA